MPRLGPNFSTELEQAGLAGKPFAWNPETGEIVNHDLSAADLGKLRALIASHNPNTPGPPPPPHPLKVIAAELHRRGASETEDFMALLRQYGIV
jgi:hypothetical protein